MQRGTAADSQLVISTWVYTMRAALHIVVTDHNFPAVKQINLCSERTPSVKPHPIVRCWNLHEFLLYRDY